MTTALPKTAPPPPTIADGVRSMDLTKEIDIAAPPELVFESVLDEMGPGSEMPDGTPFPMKIEPWPGGRWYRDTGNNTGHFWGHVQVIKPPPHPFPVLEVCGPMFMSYPAVSHVQYRLIPHARGTTLRVTHRAIGLIPDQDSAGVHEGWRHGMNRIKSIAERRAAR